MAKKWNWEPKPTIFAYYNDEAPGAIELRRLARNVRHRGNPSEIKSILVTSATKHEGKTLIAANLAIAIAKREEGKKVLLVDCDLRRPKICSLFGFERKSGLVSLLADEAKLKYAVIDTELDNLKVLPSGCVVDSPSRLLAGVKDALDKCKEQFDILICDSPPVVPVDDAAIFARHVDGVLLVVMAGKTDRVVAKRALDLLRDAKAKVLGVVLNNMHGALPYYYDYKYYRYKYARKEPERGMDSGSSED